MPFLSCLILPVKTVGPRVIQLSLNSTGIFIKRTLSTSAQSLTQQKLTPTNRRWQAVEGTTATRIRPEFSIVNGGSGKGINLHQYSFSTTCAIPTTTEETRVTNSHTPTCTSSSISQTVRRMSSDNTKSTIVIFLGSTRPGRMVERVGKFVRNVVEANGIKAIVFDPVDMAFEVIRQPLHFMRNPEEAPAWLKEADATIQQADGFIVVSAEYNCGIPPALANMMDHFPPKSYRHRPCGIITYSMGNFGGIRASTILRPFASELGLITVPSYVPIPTVGSSFDEEGNCQVERIATNIDKMVKEVEWYANAIRTQKKIASPPL